MVTTTGHANGAGHGPDLLDAVPVRLRAEDFGDGDGELVLGVLLAFGREALDTATSRYGLERRDFYRAAHKAVYGGIVAQPERHRVYAVEAVLEWVVREAGLSEAERPLLRDLEEWRRRGDAYGPESLEPYVERLQRARRTRTLAQRLARAQAALAAGEVDAAEAELRSLLEALEPTSPPISMSMVGGEVECTGADLLAAADEPARTSLPLLGQTGYFSKGWSHLLSGYPRVGKTELLLRLAAEWIAAGETVLWLTEEPRSIWKERLGAVPGDWAKLTLRFALGEPVDVLRARGREGPGTVVIWDTLRNLLLPHDEKDNSELARLVNPIIAETRRAGKTLVVGHHDTKTDAEHGKGIAGGHALMACFDAPLEVKFDGASKARRVIESHARLVRPPELVYELGEDGTMRALGDPEGAQLAAVAARCAEVVEGEWAKTGDVWDALGDPRPSQEQVRKALVLLAREGRAERDPPLAAGGVPGKTVRWRRAAEGAR